MDAAPTPKDDEKGFLWFQLSELTFSASYALALPLIQTVQVGVEGEAGAVNLGVS